MAKHNVRLADFPQLPSPVYFRYSDFAPDTECTPHQHFWGSLDYSASGVMRMEVAGKTDFFVKQPIAELDPAMRVGDVVPIGWQTEHARALDPLQQVH